MNNDKRLSAKQVANILDMSVTNLKFYAVLLEQNGLVLFRNTRNHREYTQDDVKLLRAMQYLNKEKSMQLEDAASKVMSSDTNIDALLSQDLPQVVATIDSNVSVVKQDRDNNIRLLTQLFEEQKADMQALRDEIQSRDKLLIDFKADISDKLTLQSELIEQQSVMIQQLKNELENERTKKVGFWSKLFH